VTVEAMMMGAMTMVEDIPEIVSDRKPHHIQTIVVIQKISLKTVDMTTMTKHKIVVENHVPLQKRKTRGQMKTKHHLVNFLLYLSCKNNFLH
jgi:hypothetical protein